jgi:hypothetical protein
MCDVWKQGLTEREPGAGLDMTKVFHRKAKETEISGKSVSKVHVHEPKVGDRAINESDIRRIESKR